MTFFQVRSCNPHSIVLDNRRSDLCDYCRLLIQFLAYHTRSGCTRNYWRRMMSTNRNGSVKCSVSCQSNSSRR